VGGFQTDPTVIEKGFPVQKFVRTQLQATFLYDIAVGPGADRCAEPSDNPPWHLSTSSVETYVLNASFLI
jgi:hypothetical protein